MNRETGQLQNTADPCTDQIEATVRGAFPDRIYFRIRREINGGHVWDHLSTLPDWIGAVGIGPGGNVLARVHEDDQDRLLMDFHRLLTHQAVSLRPLVRFCGDTGICAHVRMSIIRSAADEKAVDGYFEREEVETNLLSRSWLGNLLERMDTSYTLINYKFEIVDFNSRSNDYAVAVLGRPLVVGDSILSYATEESKPLLVADLEQAFSGHEVHREWKDTDSGQNNVFSFVYIPVESTSESPSLVAMCTHDLTDRRQLESQQKELAVAVAQSPISVVITDPDGTIKYVNPFFEELTGYAATEVVGKDPRILQSATSDAITDYRAMWTELSAGRTWTGEFLNRKKNGDEYRERAILVPLTNQAHQVTSIVGLKEDVTTLHETINQLEDKEQHFHALFDNAAEAIYIHDTTGIIRDVNPIASVQTGYTKAELIGMHVGNLDGGSGNTPPEEVVKLLKEPPQRRAHHVAFETIGKRKDGTEFPAEVTLFLFASRGEQLIAATMVDATERKKQIATIQQSAEDNAVLLRELHHRVKNNLQSIASLLRLQLDSLRDPVDRELFEDNINRVLSMATVHAMLHEANSLTTVDLRVYLEQLIRRSLDWSQTQDKHVSITIEGDSVVGGIEQAVPFGLIANELIMNAIQHTTTDSPREIVVSIRDTEGQGVFTIRDNGKADAAKILRSSGTGFGTTLIEALAQQISGNLQIGSGPGWHVTLAFSPKGRNHHT